MNNEISTILTITLTPIVALILLPLSQWVKKWFYKRTNIITIRCSTFFHGGNLMQLPGQALNFDFRVLDKNEWLMSLKLPESELGGDVPKTDGFYYILVNRQHPTLGIIVSSFDYELHFKPNL